MQCFHYKVHSITVLHSLLPCPKTTKGDLGLILVMTRVLPLYRCRAQLNRQYMSKEIHSVGPVPLTKWISSKTHSRADHLIIPVDFVRLIKTPSSLLSLWFEEELAVIIASVFLPLFDLISTLLLHHHHHRQLITDIWPFKGEQFFQLPPYQKGN